MTGGKKSEIIFNQPGNLSYSFPQFYYLLLSMHLYIDDESPEKMIASSLCVPISRQLVANLQMQQAVNMFVRQQTIKMNSLSRSDTEKKKTASLNSSLERPSSLMNTFKDFEGCPEVSEIDNFSISCKLLPVSLSARIV